MVKIKSGFQVLISSLFKIMFFVTEYLWEGALLSGWFIFNLDEIEMKYPFFSQYQDQEGVDKIQKIN